MKISAGNVWPATRRGRLAGDALAASVAKLAEEAAQIEGSLAAARKKFDELDADSSGALEQGEIEKLAQWVFAQFHPDGEPMSPQQQDSEMAKLMELDTNKDGKLDFDEFSGWFDETAQKIFQFKREQRWLAAEAAKAADAAQAAQKKKKAGEGQEATARRGAQIQNAAAAAAAKRGLYAVTAGFLFTFAGCECSSSLCVVVRS